MEYRFRIGQDELKRLYENAKDRMDAHPDFAEKHITAIRDCPHFKSEKRALEVALNMEKDNPCSCQIWAKIENVNDIYRIQDYWLVTDDGKVKMSADYIGMALMYDETRLQNIIDSNAKIDDIIAYY